MSSENDVEYGERERALIGNPRQTLVVGLNTLFTAMRAVAAAREGTLDEKSFNTTFTLVNEENPEGDRFRIVGAEQPMPLELRLENVMKSVAATVFVQFDEVAAQETSGLKGGRFAHADPGIQDALSLLYLIRCAFAHNPLVPTWKIDRKHFQDRLFRVPTIDLELDTTGLNGQVGVVNRIGGWVGALKLLDYCLSVIAPDEASAMRPATGAKGSAPEGAT